MGIWDAPKSAFGGESSPRPHVARIGENPQIEGEIGYLGLVDWWLSTFTQAERDYIEERYKPFSLGGNPAGLTKGKIWKTTQTPAMFLSGLASWFRKPEDRHIARRLLAKAEEVAGEDILGLHFTYLGMIENFYRDREKDPEAFDAAVAACEKQIAIALQAAEFFKRKYPKSSLPGHSGFVQLAIIREKQGSYAEAIRLSRTALQQGWYGDWEKRIARCEKKQKRKAGNEFRV
jgi:hypothetical protein